MDFESKLHIESWGICFLYSRVLMHLY